MESVNQTVNQLVGQLHAEQIYSLAEALCILSVSVSVSSSTCLFRHNPALAAKESGLYSLAISTGSIHLTGDTTPNHLHHTPRSAAWTGSPDTRARQVTSRPAKMAAICFHFNRQPSAVINICRASRYTNMRPATESKQCALSDTLKDMQTKYEKQKTQVFQDLTECHWMSGSQCYEAVNSSLHRLFCVGSELHLQIYFRLISGFRFNHLKRSSSCIYHPHFHNKNICIPSHSAFMGFIYK